MPRRPVLFVLSTLLLVPFLWLFLDSLLPRSGGLPDPWRPRLFLPEPAYTGPYMLTTHDMHPCLSAGEDPAKSPFDHPLLPAAGPAEQEWDDYVILSVREGRLLKVLVCPRNRKDFLPREDYWHIFFPDGKDLTGMAARYVGDEPEGVRFADGTELHASAQPPDAVPIGSSEWPYEMRWRRLWPGYYLVAVYRGDARVCAEWLTREKDGRDVDAVLGKSHHDVTWRSRNMRAAWLGEDIILYASQARGHFEFIPLDPETRPALPPDFPRRLLRGWDGKFPLE